MSARDELLDEYGRADTVPPWSLADLRQKLAAYRAEVRREVLGDDLNPSELVLNANAYRWLADAISNTMTDPDRWDGDEAEEAILARYVEWLAGERAEHRAEALAEAKREVVGWLEKKAREYRSTGSAQHALQADAIEVMASKIDRGAVRLFPNAAGKVSPAGAEITQSTDFFQPGRTYTYGQTGYRAPELTVLFWVEHVTRHPERGHLRAIGWSKTGEPGSKWRGDFQDEDQFEGWAEVPEGGESRG